MQVLISHAIEDEEAATALKELIRRCSLHRIEVWFSSDRSALGGMPIGGPWFSELHEKLKATDWIVALVTPRSVSNPWLYFECGFGAANRTHSVVPIALGLPISSVPMPLAAYQIYDAENALSLSTFLHKMLEVAGVLFDEEMTRSVRESAKRRLINHGNKARHLPEQIQPTSNGDITTLQSFIEQRFVELYELLPTSNRPNMTLELTFDASEITKKHPQFTLNVPSGSSFGDVLDELYFRIADYVSPFTYLLQWTINDTKENVNISIDAIRDLVPVNILLKSDRVYKLKRLTDGDDYVQRALRYLRKKPPHESQ